MTSSPDNKHRDFLDVIVALILPATVVSLVLAVALTSGGCSGAVSGIEFESATASPSNGATTNVDNSAPAESADQTSPNEYGSYPQDGPGLYDRPDEERNEGDQTGDQGDPSGELAYPGCQPGEGCWGEPCTADADCYDGVCVVDQGEGVCSMTCLNDCPSGFSCVLESPSGTDPTWICASDHEKLCQPCAQSSECSSFSDVESICVPYTEFQGLSLETTHGHFCATTCADNEQCPNGFECQETTDQLGELVQVCVHAELTCDCSSAALELNLKTACTIGNDAGICSGARVCSEAGLTSCDAPEPTLESCDGLDNDCDGDVDEEIPPTTCGQGACQHQMASCVDGVSAICDDLLGATPESCDGVDNDCDGQTDEELGTIECGVGECSHETASCVDGQLAVCDPYLGATAESCDGVDNDCDGETDEVDAEGCLFHYADIDSDGHGAGVPLCLCAPDGEHVQPVASDCDDLNPLVHPGTAEQCNGLDDNCDGTIDEDQGSLSCGVGQCAQTKPACANGAPQQCDPFEGAQQETCDGLDNDCDGEADEELSDLVCGQGVCAKTVTACIDGAPQACDAFAEASEEICDGLDNDCDGEVDEGLGSLSCGQGVCAKSISACVGGQPQSCDAFAGAGAEVCDGLDNDCDGKVDEGLGKISCGQGVCAKSVKACAGGSPQSCDAYAGASQEKCDGLDNDCDGKVDEGACHKQESSGCN